MKKGCAQVEHHATTARVPKWHRVHQPIMSSEGPESTDINWELAQQESASILNVLSAPMPADISMECTNVFDCSCFDSYNVCPLANRSSILGVKMKHNWSKQQHNYHKV